MPNQTTRKCAALTAVVILLLAGDSSALAGKGKNRGRGGSSRGSSQQRAVLQSALQQTKSLVSAAKQALADAQQRGAAAQAKARGALLRLQADSAALEGAILNAQAASDALEEIENRILDSQDSESVYFRLKNDLERAKVDYDRARQDVERSEEYKLAYSEAAESANRAEMLPEVRQQFFEDNARFQSAARRMAILRRSFGAERHRLLSNNPDRQAASETARQARVDQAKVQQHLNAGLLHRAAARSALTRATQQATAAHQTVQSGSSTVKALEKKSKSLAKSGRSGKSGNYKRSKR